jgi:hypothetical protein
VEVSFEAESLPRMFSCKRELLPAGQSSAAGRALHPGIFRASRQTADPGFGMALVHPEQFDFGIDEV